MSEVINSSMVFNEIKCILFRDYNWVAAVHICTITFDIWQKQQLVDPKVFLRHPHTENIVWLLPPKLCFVMTGIGIDCGIVDICIVIQSVVCIVVCLTAVEIVSSCIGIVVLDHTWVVTGERVAINPEFFNLKISWISLQLIIYHKGKPSLSKTRFLVFTKILTPLIFLPKIIIKIWETPPPPLSQKVLSFDNDFLTINY